MAPVPRKWAQIGVPPLYILNFKSQYEGKVVVQKSYVRLTNYFLYIHFFWSVSLDAVVICPLPTYYTLKGVPFHLSQKVRVYDVKEVVNPIKK